MRPLAPPYIIFIYSYKNVFFIIKKNDEGTKKVEVVIFPY
jgi:hypothetical protein